MTTTILTLTSHLLFMALSFHLLTTVVDWAKFTKLHADNIGRLNLLVIVLSMALGYIASSFFLELLALGRSMALQFF